MTAPSPIIRVLVVDDSATFRQSISKLLKANPFIDVVALAGTGEEAVRAADYYHPDVIVLDLVMPHGDGLSVIENLCGRVAIVVVTSMAIGSPEIARAKECGAYAVIAKPTSPTDINRFRDELIKTTKMARSM